MRYISYSFSKLLSAVPHIQILA